MLAQVHEQRLRDRGCEVVVGIDEVGRGPLAGPVMAAAVVVPADEKVRGYLLGVAGDSKVIKEPVRRSLAEFIETHCRVGVGSASVEEIDAVNIRNATFLAMARAVEELKLSDMRCGYLVDGNARVKELVGEQLTVVKGDGCELAIACASLVAKVRRDALMVELAREFPHYGWDRNMGYGTAVHMRALEEVGVSAHHRVSFAPVREALRGRAA